MGSSHNVSIGDPPFFPLGELFRDSQTLNPSQDSAVVVLIFLIKQNMLTQASQSSGRRLLHGALALRQCGTPRHIREEAIQKPILHFRRVHLYHWRSSKGRHCMHIYLRRFLCSNLGSYLVDIPPGVIPAARSRKGRRSSHIRQVSLPLSLLRPSTRQRTNISTPTAGPSTLP